MSPRTGRPKLDSAKRHDMKIRMGDDDVQKLEYCCKVSGLTKADIIRQGVQAVYDRLQEQENHRDK